MATDPIYFLVGLSSAAATAIVGYAAHYSVYKERRRRKLLVEDEILGHPASQGVEYKPSLSERVHEVKKEQEIQLSWLIEVRRLLGLNGHHRVGT